MFLNDHRIALVEGASIAPLFAHSLDKRRRPGARTSRARGRRGALRSAACPRFPTISLPAGVQSAQLANLARSVQWVTLAARPEGDNVRISLEGECATPTDARQLQSALEILRLFGQAALQNPKTSQTMDPATFRSS